MNIYGRTRQRSLDPAAQPALRSLRVFADDTMQESTVREFAVGVWMLAGSAVLHDGRAGRRALQPGDAFHRHPQVPRQVLFHAGSRVLYLAVPAEGLALLRATGARGLDAAVIRPGLQRDLARRWQLIERDLARAHASSAAPLAGRMVELLADLHHRAAAGGDAHLAGQMESVGAELGDAEGPRRRLPEIARGLGLSYRTFRRAFTAYAGVPPELYRIRCRVAIAQDLLRRDALSVAAIAARLGYRDTPDFSRQFAHVTGCSPRVFRQRSPA